MVEAALPWVPDMPMCQHSSGKHIKVWSNLKKIKQNNLVATRSKSRVWTLSQNHTEKGDPAGEQMPSLLGTLCGDVIKH